jgi:predicted negative regulator of RcsB-dependent stress response
VTFTATDIHGNTASCSFTVTVKTVLQTLADLRAQVAANQQLAPPQRNGLLGKLDAAKQHIENGNQNGACSKLADFVNSTQNFINNGSLSAATGNAWISTANNIRNTIGCTNNPCT